MLLFVCYDDFATNNRGKNALRFKNKRGTVKTKYYGRVRVI